MRKFLAISLFCASTCFAIPAAAQDSSSWPEASTPSVLPRADFRFPGNVGRTIEDSDPAQFPQPVQAPKGAPNVVLILLDDAGYGQFSTFGGGIQSPTMDALAKDGLRYTRFHTTALCSPTRAALITGRNHHSVASGVIGEAATGYDGYTSIIPKSAGTIGEVLRQNGYMTAWIGKNHNTPAWEISAAGPFDRWANGLGFDYFYGFNAGDMNHWNPILYENRDLVPASKDPDYYMTTDFADKAIAWVRKVKTIAPERPFFLYVATGATHSPHQVPAKWIEPYKGKFDEGWDAYREHTLARQKQLGVVPQNTDLTARSEGLPAWDSLNPDQKRLYSRMMEVFAGYGANADYEMGRVIDAVKALPGAENTIFIYIAGDNGSSAEGGLEGSTNENLFFNGIAESWEDNIKVIDELGGPKHFNHFTASWAHAMDTPFQWTKQVASHFGGTRNPMIISWPGHVTDPGGLRNQFVHTIDIVPTLYQIIGITPPEELNGVPQKPIEGISFADTLLELTLRNIEPSNISSSSAIGASTRMAGWRRRRPPRHGSQFAKNTIPTPRSGSFTTSPRISPRRTTWRRRTRRSCASCRTCGGPRQRATMCCRLTGAQWNGSTLRQWADRCCRARQPASPTILARSAFRPMHRHAFSTSLGL